METEIWGRNETLWIFDSNASGPLSMTSSVERSVEVTAPVDILGMSSMSDEWAFSMAGGIWVNQNFTLTGSDGMLDA